MQRKCHRIVCAAALVLTSIVGRAGAEEIQTDILVVGGTESGWAAAIQAARMGVRSVTIVHDGTWLGGQYTEQALACVDENKGVGTVGWGPDWHPMKRSFHRFGLFKELMDAIEQLNTDKYGSPMPGLPFHGPTTFRPAEAEGVFRRMLQPYIDSGQVRLVTGHYPAAAFMTDGGRRLTGLRFAAVSGGGAAELSVRATLTIDASDWGDAVQVSGAEFDVGTDPRSRYGEPSAPEDMSSTPANEMNPITWAMVVEQSDGPTPIAMPGRFDDRYFAGAVRSNRDAFASLKWDHKVKLGGIPAWPAPGKVAERQLTIYTVRRIVEGTLSKDDRTSILLCYTNGQDYPLERLPKPVADALEATERGASEKNIVLMTRAQRQIIFDDVKRHSLALLYHLQHFVHDHAADTGYSFRNFHLSSEFGTPDSLPPKPYIRESLRLKALYMMREGDGLNTDGADKKAAKEAFATVMYPDGLFSWQFHYDFHNTGRTYLKGDADRSGPWVDYEKPGRNTSAVSDRSVFPLRSLIPVRVDGLLGAQRNVGYSSVVSAAIRLHDQAVHVGQAAAATAVLCLRHGVQPRDLAMDRGRLEEIRDALCGGTAGVPMLLWPYRDLPADHPAFVAINRLAARGLLPVSRREVDFHPDALADDAWRAEVTRLCGVSLAAAPGQTRGQFAVAVWAMVKDQPLKPWPRLKPDDADADGVPDADDPLPFTAARSSW